VLVGKKLENLVHQFRFLWRQTWPFEKH